MLRYKVSLLSIVILMIVSTLPVRAEYPDRPITLIAPFSSTVDVFSVVADGLKKELGVPVAVELHPGTGGLYAMRDLLQAKPDGYTIMMASGPNLIMSFYQKPPYDPSQITLIGLSVAFPPPVIVVPSSYRGSLSDFLKKVRSSPRFIWASGTRTTAHMAGLQFMSAAGAKTVHQPTRDANVSLSVLFGGFVDAAVESGSFISAAMQKSGTVRPIAVLAEERHPMFPGVQTPHEVGITDHFLLKGMNCIVAPPGTPPIVAQRLRTALYKVMHDPEVQRQIRHLYFDPVATPLPEMESATKRWLTIETAEWEKVIKTYGLDLLN